MQQKTERAARATIDMDISTFEIPPSGEILILGKRCAIGPLAAKKMLDTVAPDQFELIQPQDDLIDGILVKKDLCLRVEKEKLVNTVIDEAKRIMSPECMIRIQCKITVSVKREV